MKIKVCGMRERNNILQVAALEPDYMGFIFYDRSPRYAGGMAPETIADLPQGIARVGVFVDATYGQIARTVERYRLDVIQLHGSEPADLCLRLREVRPVVKAIGVSSAGDVQCGRHLYGGAADCLLFDTLTPQHGGSGRKFDWTALADGREGRKMPPYFLSGGIGPEDAESVKSLARPGCCNRSVPGLTFGPPGILHAIDLNSRFEIAPGVKDVALLARFIEEVRGG